MSPPSRRRPSPGTILGAIALFVALGGTALAATGTIVNIADGTTAANVAKVDSGGALRTSAIPAAPTKPFNAGAYVPDAYITDYTVPFAGSTATIAINRIVLSA